MTILQADSNGRARFSTLELDTQVYVDPTETYTVVVLSGERYTGVGVAKRFPKDPIDPQIGFDLASARALRELANLTEEGAHHDSQ